MPTLVDRIEEIIAPQIESLGLAIVRIKLFGGRRQARQNATTRSQNPLQTSAHPFDRTSPLEERDDGDFPQIVATSLATSRISIEVMS